VNAIVSGLNCITKLKRLFASVYTDPNLGVTTLNVAYCQGGLDNGQGGYGRQGNNIADLSEFVLDIRTASEELNAKKVRKLLLSYARAAKLELENWVVRHDLGMWSTTKELLIPTHGKEYRYEPSLGYIDTQMLWEAFNKLPCSTIGAGNLALAHQPNEYVETRNLESTKLLVEKIIQRRL
jgi:acetylornithine deacetylase/succinyl-diaminopimelate desuccinylase-like protein